MSSAMDTLHRYIDANNACDVDAAVAVFAADAVVKDEGHTHCGRDAIRAWRTSTGEQYQTVLTIVDAHDADGVLTARLGVAGTFAGSPITLRHRFTIINNQIQTLEIG